MNMVRVYESILVIIMVSVMDIALTTNPYNNDHDIVMIPTPGSSSTNQVNPDEILGYVFNQTFSFGNKPLSTLRDHLRSDRRIMNGNGLRMELVDHCDQVFNTHHKDIKVYLVLACSFLNGYVANSSSTTPIANVDIDPDDNWKAPVRGMFKFLFSHKESKLRDKISNGRKKIPKPDNKPYIKNKCQQILQGNTADLMVWQVVGCDFITVYI